MKQETDEHARVRSVLVNETGAFEALVRDYQKLCWHIVFRMVRDPDDARDLCQETFLRVHRQLHQFRFECPLKSWIGRIAYSIALRHLERRRAAPVTHLDDEDESTLETLADESFDLEADSGDEQLGHRLREGVDALPALPRTLVTLFHLEELSIAEIATITGMSEGTIKSHLFRARLTLRDWLRRRGVGEP
ncbi:MAG TPA: sigma-70 family RNA polymerase sigma factor [Steroidobacteraceae bacterium]|jgi:RNA polymerase sigma-70 factor (ECF subfamily)|nr:sigma-70 family RNA polymerase sigma factor [Steroidobacteraceae bacterium]